MCTLTPLLVAKNATILSAQLESHSKVYVPGLKTRINVGVNDVQAWNPSD